MTDFLDQQFLLRTASYATDCYNSLFSQQCQREDDSICSLSTYTHHLATPAGPGYQSINTLFSRNYVWSALQIRSKGSLC